MLPPVTPLEKSIGFTRLAPTTKSSVSHFGNHPEFDEQDQLHTERSMVKPTTQDRLKGALKGAIRETFSWRQVAWNTIVTSVIIAVFPPTIMLFPLFFAVNTLFGALFGAFQGFLDPLDDTGKKAQARKSGFILPTSA